MNERSRTSIWTACSRSLKMAHKSLARTTGSEQTEHQISERGSQQRAVDDVQDSAEARDQFAAVFDLGVALHEGFEEVPQLADAADDYAEDEAFGPWQGIDRRIDPAGEERADR